MMDVFTFNWNCLESIQLTASHLSGLWVLVFIGLFSLTEGEEAK